MKNYIAEKGVPISASWADHLHFCAQCKLYDASKPATLALMCLEGSVLWKRENVTAPARVAEAKGDNWCTKDQLKRAMRYKGE